MRLLYVHIGLHKTGTTSIQWYLNRHARKLNAHGIYVPRAGCASPQTSAHHHIAWSLLGCPHADPARGDLDLLLRELDGVAAPRAVISSEDFSHLVHAPETLSAFDAALCAHGWAPVYLLFLRAPGGYALSLFRELRRQGIEMSFPHFLKAALADPPMPRLGAHFDYESFASRWRAATSGELRIASYDAAADVVADTQAGCGCVIPAFIEALGLPPRYGRLRKRRLNVTTEAANPEMQRGARLFDAKYGAGFQRLTTVGPDAPARATARLAVAAAPGVIGSASVSAPGA